MSNYDEKSPSELRGVYPLVRIRACGPNSNGVTECAEGSGYLLDRWLDTVVTAEHVVTNKGRITPKTVEVHLWYRNRSSIAKTIAVGTGYGAGVDVAAVRLDGPVQGLELTMPHGAPPAFEFDAQLAGWADAGAFESASETRISVRAGRSGRYIEHFDFVGFEGLSGGPLLHGDKAVGVYRGTSPTGMGTGSEVSTLLDVDLLKQLRRDAS